ncbi:SPOR domain-containing protein [Fuscibacter oryzae]|uniref:SPOR domain-containing protein n=1 Tax=Fuscibacter oryzae TaxID=2803939 RepID=A0A8J7SUM0_9RHOB|nr:SPOR domain-containing protein [Fuscibacter oryzae]MBL4928652.1 SPOR domain-containing protein [Fuscibacter oryzae]
MAGMAIGRILVVSALATALAGCQSGMGPFASRSKGAATAGSATAAGTGKSVKLVDRDVEAPQVFQVTDTALWDGRPSLGGVWVASPDVKDPERVILRNPANGKFVIGGLFRRERDNPGPKLQISSDAADALGMLAGQPGKISVTALRREEAATAAPDATKPILDSSETVATEAIAPPPGAKPGTPPVAAPVAAPAPKGKPVAAPPPAAKPAAPAPAAKGGLIQIGFFSVEANAKRAVDQLAKAGVSASIREEKTQGKSSWSVTARGDAASLAKAKSAGFKDAYLLKR